MGYKFIVLFAVAILAAVQVYAEDDIQYPTENYKYLDDETLSLSHAEYFDKTNESQLKDKIEYLLYALKRAVVNFLEPAQKGIDFARNNLNEFADKVQTAARKELQGLEDDFRAELDKLKEQAKNAGANIDDCLEGNEDTLVNLPTELADDTVHCVSDKLNYTTSYVQDALDQFKKVFGDIGNLKQEYKNCGSGFSSVACLTKVAIKIEVDISILPARIGAETSAAVAQIALLYRDVKHCAVEKVDQCKHEGYKVLETIDVCVSKKIVKKQ